MAARRLLDSRSAKVAGLVPISGGWIVMALKFENLGSRLPPSSFEGSRGLYGACELDFAPSLFLISGVLLTMLGLSFLTEHILLSSSIEGSVRYRVCELGPVSSALLFSVFLLTVPGFSFLAGHVLLSSTLDGNRVPYGRVCELDAAPSVFLISAFLLAVSGSSILVEGILLSASLGGDRVVYGGGCVPDREVSVVYGGSCVRGTAGGFGVFGPGFL